MNPESRSRELLLFHCRAFCQSVAAFVSLFIYQLILYFLILMLGFCFLHVINKISLIISLYIYPVHR